MGRNRSLAPAVRLAALAGVALLLSAAPAAGAQERVLACRASQYLPALPTTLSRVYTILSLANYDSSNSIQIRRIVIFDRNGAQLCEYSQANPLPAKAFDPSVPFDFTRPLGPHQVLNVSTTVLACVPWPPAHSDDIAGTLSVFVHWSFEKGKHGVPLNGAAVVFVQEIQSTLLSSRSSSACEEI